MKNSPDRKSSKLARRTVKPQQNQRGPGSGTQVENLINEIVAEFGKLSKKAQKETLVEIREHIAKEMVNVNLSC